MNLYYGTGTKNDDSEISVLALTGHSSYKGKETMITENKTKPTLASVDDFITGIENSRRRADSLVALKIYKEVTGVSPYMCGPSIIGFGTHHYVYDSGREGTVPAGGFSPRKVNMTFYVGNKFEGAETLYANLGKHKKSVACLYINKLDDIDLQVLREIIDRDYARALQTSK